MSAANLQIIAQRIEKNARFLQAYSADVVSKMKAIDFHEFEKRMLKMIQTQKGTVVRVMGFPPGVTEGRGWFEAEVIEHVHDRDNQLDLVRVRRRDTRLGDEHLVLLDDVRPYSAVEVLVEQHRREKGGCADA